MNFLVLDNIFCPVEKIVCAVQLQFYPRQKIFCLGRWTGHLFDKEILLAFYKLVILIFFLFRVGRKGLKREHGTTFCFDFCLKFGDHRALYHIPIIIIPTLTYTVLERGYELVAT